MSPFENYPPEVLGVLKACIKHAGDLLKAAIIIQKEAKFPNIAYHLAALSIEEIGNFDIMRTSYLARAEDKPNEWLEKQTEDHVKKLFWGLWGPSFGRDIISRSQIESYNNHARKIHEKRISGLYVNMDKNINGSMPCDLITTKETDNIIELATMRLEMEKSRKYVVDINPNNKKTMRWFLDANKDPEKQKMIFCNKSMEKLAELGEVKKWVEWLEMEFNKAEEESRLQTEKELNRTITLGDEANKDKWKIKIRLYSNSHSIRPKSLNKLNHNSNWIKLLPVKNNKKEALLEIVLPNKVPIAGLWWAGWGAARRFVVALNIGSLGFFWWYIPEQISKYYENIEDLELKDKMDVIIERDPILRLDWGREALTENDIANTMMCFGKLPGPDEREKVIAFDHYITGLAFLGKNDIHIQFELNAYEQFYKSLKAGMQAYGDLDKNQPIITSIGEYVNRNILVFNNVSKYLELGEQFETKDNIPRGITLSEVGAIKILCDAYFLHKFKTMAFHHIEQEQVKSEQ